MSDPIPSRLGRLVRGLRDGLVGARPDGLGVDALPWATDDATASTVAEQLDRVRAQLWGRRWRRWWPGSEAAEIRRLMRLEERLAEQFTAAVAGAAAGDAAARGWRSTGPGTARWDDPEPAGHPSTVPPRPGGAS